jgi:hypothetical protein
MNFNLSCMTYCNGFTETVTRQRLDKHPTTNLHATIGRVFSIVRQQRHAIMEEYLFSVCLPLRGLHNASPNDSNLERPRVEAGSNNSTVALRVVNGDGKGTQCPGV